MKYNVPSTNTILTIIKHKRSCMRLFHENDMHAGLTYDDRLNCYERVKSNQNSIVQPHSNKVNSEKLSLSKTTDKYE